MEHGCALDSGGLHPSSHALPEGGPARRAPSRLLVPGFGGRGVRVRSLALGVSALVHALLVFALLASGLDAPLPEPPALIDVEFVEIGGARGGGGSAASASKVAAPQASKAARAAQAPPKAVPVPSTFAPPVPKAAPESVSQTAVQATAARTTGATASAGAGQSAGQSDGLGGSGGGSGGGQGTGRGGATGPGTGQGGLAVDRMPAPLRTVKPRYPMAARRAGQEGQVLLRLFVDAEGRVGQVAVLKAEPEGLFEESALEAVRKWRFSPAMNKGAAVGMWLTLPVRFALER
ncbi:outer membrane transport energization protein TonB [Humidesulfovibrio mexicanus]|uniref:Outer membrane transport energization protein TonB n=1 Tax=Humidesulfovibrio mexicanus TaxID=147047 RepID=A0A239CP49_9BACT|nr:energy transducer TonB [Humidesulfovibrio mexicanus]SNS21461.1 outer membrane transport energization protein TonB [Humidesulfovibrio mexicanus]